MSEKNTIRKNLSRKLWITDVLKNKSYVLYLIYKIKNNDYRFRELGNRD